MSRVSVKETAQHGLPRRGVSRRRMVSIGFVALIVALLLGVWFIYLPWLLRSKVEDALRSAGVRGISFDVERATPWGSELINVAAGGGQSLGIRRVVLDYSPVDLWEGKLDAIHIVGGRLELDVRDGQVDFSPLAKLIAQNEPRRSASATQPANLPVARIDFADSNLVINTEKQTLTVPVDVTIVGAKEGKVVIDARVGPNRNLIVGGMVDLAANSATFEGAASAGWTLLTARTIWPDAQVGVDGFLQLTGSARWGDDGPSGLLRVEIAPPGSATQPPQPPGKLQLTSGVFVVTANLGAEAVVRVDVRDAGFAVADAALAGEGVSGELVLHPLSPLATPPGQKFTARKLSIGQMNLSDGEVVFQMPDSNTINIPLTRWKWLAGELTAQGIRVRDDEPIHMVLHLREVDLEGMLELLAKDKATGEGKLTGTLPVTIRGSDIEFGEGRITAISGGTVRIKDAAAILPTAEAAARSVKDPSAAEQIKHNIIEALSDFQFKRLTAQLNEEDGKTVAYVRMSGHGRTGAKQSVDYELKVTGVDLLLKAYLNVQAAMPQAAELRRTGATTTRKASP